VFWTQVHSLLTDLPATAAVAAGAALTLRAARTDRHRLRWLILAGLAFGLAAGSKYTALPAAVAGLAFIALLCRPRPRAVAAVLVAFAAPAAFWYVRNLVITGNPVFPTEVRIAGHVLFAGPTGPLSSISTTLFDHIVHGRSAILGRTAHLLLVYLGPCLALGAAGVAVLLLARRRPQAAAVGLFAAVCAVAYTVTPVTGGGPDGLEFLIGSNLRYLLPALALAAATVAAVWPRAAVATAACALAYDAYRILDGPGFRPDVTVDAGVFVCAALVCVAVALALRMLRFPVAIPRLAGGAVLVAGAAALVLAATPALSPVRNPQTAPVAAAMSASGAGHGVVLINVNDVRDAVPPSTGLEPAGVGTGGQGQLSPASGAQNFQHALDSLNPGVVVVGSGATAFAPPPPGWTPPPTWQKVGTTGAGGTVYVVTAPTACVTAPPVTAPAGTAAPTSLPSPVPGVGGPLQTPAPAPSPAVPSPSPPAGVCASSGH
jgi:hypothetical protein